MIHSDIRSMRGLTLIEIMVVLSVAALLGLLAAPSFSTFAAGQRVKSVSFDLAMVLNSARSEAIKRNANVIVAPHAAGWSSGWTVTAGTEVVENYAAPANVTVALTCGLSPCPITYTGMGTTAATLATFDVSAQGAAYRRCVEIDLSGRPNIRKEAC